MLGARSFDHELAVSLSRPRACLGRMTLLEQSLYPQARGTFLCRRGLSYMRAVTIVPRSSGSLGLADIADPVPGKNDVLVKTRAIGICGTDRELIDGHYGEAPAGEKRLVLGHESL